MTLQQIFDFVNKKTYFSRDDDEIWHAINNAASQLYQEVLIENEGRFLVWDTTSLQLVANTEQYNLPQAVETMVRLRERRIATDPWRVMTPAELNDQDFVDAQFTSVLGPDQDGPVSDFSYYGPYLTRTAEQAGTFIKQIDVAPIPQDVRMCEMVYTAKFLEITGQDSTLVIDPDGHPAVEFWAAAELLADNDDDNADRMLERGDQARTRYLKIVRAKQQQQGRKVEPYVTDLD